MKCNNLDYTFKRLTEDKQLNVCYFGGSVTDGSNASDMEQSSWRALNSKHLKDSFPDAEINTYNCSIGGTGSGFGLFRIDNDLLSKNPDLVFIEFSINDCYQRYSVKDSIMFYESIIHKINSHNPYTDIVICFITDRGLLNSGNAIFDAHRKLAAYYGFPTIDFGLSVKREMANSNKDVSEYLDDWVHPTDLGHSIYAAEANSVIDFILNECLHKSPKKHSLPKLYGKELVLGTAVKTCGSDMDTSRNKGFIREENGRTFTKIAVTSYKAGDEWTFNFEGSYLGVWGDAWEASEASSKVAVIIDGEEVGTVALSSNTHMKMHVTLACGLENKKHTATIRNMEDGMFTIDYFIWVK